jgi:hypothetical protein
VIAAGFPDDAAFEQKPEGEVDGHAGEPGSGGTISPPTPPNSQVQAQALAAAKSRGRPAPSSSAGEGVLNSSRLRFDQLRRAAGAAARNRTFIRATWTGFSSTPFLMELHVECLGTLNFHDQP